MAQFSDTPVFIGDELTAAGYRLAGVRVETPPLEAAAKAFERVRRTSRLLLLTAEYAAKIGDIAPLDANDALVIVVSDARRRMPLPDIGLKLRRELGLES